MCVAIFVQKYFSINGYFGSFQINLPVNDLSIELLFTNQKKMKIDGQCLTVK